MEQTIVKKQSWWQLLSIQAGGIICLPVILVGQLVCQQYGWSAALLAVGCGNIFLLTTGYLLSSLSTYRQQTTVQHAAHYFGSRGRMLFASLMMLSMLGWFGIQLNVMSQSGAQLFHLFGIAISPLILNISLGIALSGIMCLGMRALKWLSYFSGPILGVTLLYALFSAHGAMPAAESLTISSLGGLSLVIGANIAAVIDLPTFFRHARSPKDGRICITLLYGLIVPLIEIAGIYLSAITGGSNILEVLQAGHGIGWMAWISCFVLLSGWATNNANLYSAIASSHSLPGRLTPFKRTLLLGFAGVAIACLNPLGNIEGILDLLGITIGSMGAVILASYLLERWRQKQFYGISLLSWSVGVALGICSSHFKWLITGVPTLDAFFAAGLVQLTFNKIYQRKKTYETIDYR